MKKRNEARDAAMNAAAKMKDRIKPLGTIRKRLKKIKQEKDQQTEVDRLRKAIDDLLVQVTEVRYSYLENLRTLRFSQKANERHKRANKRLRGMLDDVGWPKNDIIPDQVPMEQPEKLVPRKVRKVKLP